MMQSLNSTEKLFLSQNIACLPYVKNWFRRVVLANPRSIRASPVASPKPSPKAIWGEPDKKNASSRVPQSPFFPGAARYGVRLPSPSPAHRGHTGDAGRTEKLGGLPHVSDYLHKPLIRAFFFSSLFPSRASHPSATAGFADRFGV
jgi:hypothetical protein